MPMRDCLAVFHDYHKHLTWKTCKTSWLNCNDEKIRRVVITEAINHARTISNEENLDKILERFVMTEVQDYLKFTKGLEVPPMRPYLIYGQTLKDFPPLRKVTKIVETATQLRFSSIPFDNQVQYLKKYYTLWLEFDYKLRKWRKKDRDYFDVALDDKAFSFKKELNINKHLPTKPPPRLFVEVCMPYTKCDFENEPKSNPVTIPALMKHCMEATNFDSDEDYYKVYDSLPLVVQKGLEDQVWYYRNDYKVALLSFVAEMTEHDRKLFLGYRRKPLYKKIMEDIFRDGYPMAKYPIYKIHTDAFLKSKKKKVKLNSSIESNSTDDFDPIQVIYNSIKVFEEWEYDMDSNDSDS